MKDLSAKCTKGDANILARYVVYVDLSNISNMLKGTLQNWFFSNKTIAGSVRTLCNRLYT